MMDFNKRNSAIRVVAPTVSGFAEPRKSAAQPRKLITKKQRVLLCFDPDSQHIYTIDLSTHEVQLELDAPQAYREKAESDYRAIAKIVQLPDSEWDICSAEAWRYRRRKICEYLLHKMIDPEPTYLAQSPMSDAFANVTSLKFLVNISEYVKLEDTSPEQYYAKLNPLVLELHIDLVTCADELIKIILREIFSIFNIKLKPKKLENKFILQIAGFREYLSGNYPILSYDRVRVSLRGIQYLQVILTEVPKENQAQQSFPPIFERTVTYEIVQCKTQNRVSSQVPWEQFIHVPTLLFYPPYPLPKYNSNDRFRATTRLDVIPRFGGQDGAVPQDPRRVTTIGENIFAKQVSINEESVYEQMDRNRRGFLPLAPRVLLKEKQMEFNQMRMQMLDQGHFNLTQNRLYSGECDWPFKVKMVGITNINRLLVLDDKDSAELKDAPKRRATYNGLCPMRFVTKESAKQEEQHNTSKKKKKSENTAVKQSFLRFCKGYGDTSTMLTKPNFTPHISHGILGQNALMNMHGKFELDFTPYVLSLEVMLLYGQGLLTNYTIAQTTPKPFRKMPRWDETICFQGLKISQLPMEVRLCCNIIMHSVNTSMELKANGDEQVIGCTVVDIFDDNGRFRQGRLELNIWPFYKIDSRIASINNYNGVPIKEHKDPQYYSKLIIALDSFDTDMFWSLRDHQVMQRIGFFRSMKCKSQIYASLIRKGQEPETSKKQPSLYQREPDWKETPSNIEIAKLNNLLNSDPLSRVHFTAQDKFILMKCRIYYKSLGKNFPIFLYSIDWSEPEQISEVYRVMKIWEPLKSNEALPILDAMISDEAVRHYATQRVGKYKDDELVLFMLELTQALMFEQQHFSVLGEMLIERALMNPWVVGHELFWQLRSQLHIQPSYERYALLLESYMMVCGWFREELLKEVRVNDDIMDIGGKIKTIDKPDERLKFCRDKLRNTRQGFEKTFLFAIDPRMACNDFQVESCGILSSKKLPLWLTMSASEVKVEGQYPFDVKVVSISQVTNFEKLKKLMQQKEANADIKPNARVRIIFKCGDDLRQDLLTLQLIKIMDKIWLDFGMDFRMKPYRVISTLDQVGMIEVVLNSETTEKIHLNSGGVIGALNKSSIMTYIKKFNPNTLEKAVENFLRSCAGYCVATYVMGIGDRHSGNIMLTEMGHLFHIDFGHFLGNFKTKLGIQRERAPFVFTEEMAFVMGGKGEQQFKRFEEFCTQAYNQVRKHGHFLINIFMMMLSAGMPELQDIEDIDYLRDQLSLDLSDQEATEKFRKEIHNSLNDSWRKIDNWIHLIKHNK